VELSRASVTAGESIRPEDQALLEGEQNVLEWLRTRAPTGGEARTAGRWIEAFMGAGRAALAQEVPTENWLYLRIELPDLKVAKRVITKSLYPVLTKLAAKGTIRRFWFLLKGDTCYHLRLRIFGETATLRSAAIEALMKALRPGEPRSGVTVCRELIYEPETALFGGPWAMELVHEFFHHDSLFTMAWMGLPQQENGGLSHHQVSVIMLLHFLRSAGLDAFEQWDVWTKVYKLRPGNVEELALAWEAQQEGFRLLMYVDPKVVQDAVAAKGSKILNDYYEGVGSVGARLWEGNRTGRLERGLRHVVATNVVFHWNRFLFSGNEQVMMAYFLSKAAAPLED
jgi:thiopeptide-type bacteriocin biosynthesis protein